MAVFTAEAGMHGLNGTVIVVPVTPAAVAGAASLQTSEPLLVPATVIVFTIAVVALPGETEKPQIQVVFPDTAASVAVTAPSCRSHCW